MQAVPERLVRFARAHHRGPAQHAVCRTVGGDPDTWWSATEIAHHEGLDVTDIDQALRSVAAAEILHDGVSPRHRLYRWRHELRCVLDGSSPQAELIGLICGMPVNAGSAYSGHDATVRFCQRGCQAARRSRLRWRRQPIGDTTT